MPPQCYSPQWRSSSKGGNVTLKEGTEIIAYVDDTVKLALDGGSEASAAGSPRKTPDGPKRVLVLRNGDKITGYVEGLADGVYTVITDSGTLKIKADTVKEVKDAEPVKADK